MLDGEHEINDIFFDNVKVPVQNLIGEENKGWTYAKFLLTHERSGNAGVGICKRALKKLKEIAAEQMSNGRPLIEDSRFRDRIAQVEMELMALEITNLRVLSATAKERRALGPEVSVLKIKGSEIIQQLAELKMHALGHDALPYVREALEMDWVGNPLARRALPLLCAADLRAIFQSAQDHDLRRIHRDPEKHHLADDSRVCKEPPWNSTTAKSNSRCRTPCSVSFPATTISTSAAHFSASALGLFRRGLEPVRGTGITVAAVSGRIRRSGRQRRRHHGGDGAVRAGIAAGTLSEHGRDVRRIDPRRRLRDHQAKIPAANRRGRNANSRSHAYEAAGRYDLSLVACTAAADGGSWRLSGQKTVVLDGASANYFLVSARSSGKAAIAEGISLFLVARDAKG